MLMVFEIKSTVIKFNFCYEIITSYMEVVWVVLGFTER